MGFSPTFTVLSAKLNSDDMPILDLGCTLCGLEFSTPVRIAQSRRLNKTVGPLTHVEVSCPACPASVFVTPKDVRVAVIRQDITAATNEVEKYRALAKTKFIAHEVTVDTSSARLECTGCSKQFLASFGSQLNARYNAAKSPINDSLEIRCPHCGTHEELRRGEAMERIKLVFATTKLGMLHCALEAAANAPD